MKIIEVTIKGVTPLLMHRFGMEGADDPGKRRTGVPDYKAEAENALYRDPEGKLYQPAEHIERSMAEAGKSFKVAGKRGASYARLVGSTVDVFPDTIPHKVQNWETDARPVVVQRARVIRYRPRLDEWELDFSLRLNDEQLPVGIIKEILDHAGKYTGIGDYRPQMKGKYGKFMVTKFEEVKEEN